MDLLKAVSMILDAQRATQKPLAVILAGHNGSGKSTMWYKWGLADTFRIPLVNADRMMLSILPEVQPGQPLPAWASDLRDKDIGWMAVAQKGVEAFVAHALNRQVSFATETVFSHWQPRADGTVASKIDLIRRLQQAGYFVLLIFVGLADEQVSIARVKMRHASGGHDVEVQRLLDRFPRTRLAIQAASKVSDAAILADNSRTVVDAFTVCRVQMMERELFDIRKRKNPPEEILRWLEVVSPR